MTMRIGWKIGGGAVIAMIMTMVVMIMVMTIFRMAMVGYGAVTVLHPAIRQMRMVMMMAVNGKGT